MGNKAQKRIKEALKKKLKVVKEKNKDRIRIQKLYAEAKTAFEPQQKMNREKKKVNSMT